MFPSPVGRTVAVDRPFGTLNATTTTTYDTPLGLQKGMQDARSNAWVSIAHTTAGTSDVTLTLPAPGQLSDYLFLGELRVSVQCFRTDAAAFDLSSGLAKIQFS